MVLLADGTSTRLIKLVEVEGKHKTMLTDYKVFQQEFMLFVMVLGLKDRKPSVMRFELDYKSNRNCSFAFMRLPRKASNLKDLKVMPLDSQIAAVFRTGGNALYFFDFASNSMLSKLTRFREILGVLPFAPGIVSVRQRAKLTFVEHCEDHTFRINDFLSSEISYVLSPSSFHLRSLSPWDKSRFLNQSIAPVTRETEWSLWQWEEGRATALRIFTLPQVNTSFGIQVVDFNEKWFVAKKDSKRITQIYIYKFHAPQVELLRIHDLQSEYLGGSIKIRGNILLLRSSTYHFGVIDLMKGSLLWGSRMPGASNGFHVLPDGSILVQARNDCSDFIRLEIPDHVQSLIQSNMGEVHETLVEPSVVAPPLQKALESVLSGISSPLEHCAGLINKKNCQHSLEEWNAAHQLLVLAVKDGALDPSADVEGQVYFWRDQLYCTVIDHQVLSVEDKNRLFRCLREAHDLRLIDSPDAYIQGIHVMQSVREEVFVLKRACLFLLMRVLSLETSIESLRTALKRYRKRQLYSNLVGIALQLIPVAGGAMAKAIMTGAEIVGDLNACDVAEYALESAVTILSDENFTTLPRSRQEELTGLFEEFGYTMNDIHLLLCNR
ncbi:hypothetical protein BWQ96_04305 [Gracilariopsis chorda]|uniref:Uncharacterized protein n=1 Tax=Gracilariopsis chorda TaxID=448386 RepID=A0A2V3IUZ7_9FLOR|nr:hypothetical protein BWQ96_04305 [Gracilariopsis chorda]|eukprot:PXF45944.1 hypothetical protein BWQ96_04305 [Gracilariopsis chorda]